MQCHRWVCLVLALGACARPPAGGNGEGEGSSITVDLSPAAGGFELLDAGAKPRAALRLSPAIGQRETLASTLAMRVAMMGPGIPPLDQRLPPVEQRTGLEVTEVGPRALAVQFTFDSVGLASNESNPEISAQMRASSEAVAGWSETKQVSTRGGFVDGALAVPAGADAKLRRSLESMGESVAGLLVRLPDAPVGVGARWKQTESLRSGGLEIERTTWTHLVGRDGDRLTLELEIGQRCLSERFVREGLPGEVEVVAYESRGSGRVVQELGALVPVEASSTLSTTLRFLLPAEPDPGGGAEQPPREVSTKVDLDLHIVG